MKLYNTLTRTKEEFNGPAYGDEVKLYTCGLTVYSQPHIGNWVAYIYWDILNRVLIQNGYDVKRVQNITDVGHLVSDGDDGEDKLEKGAREENMTAQEVAKKYSEIASNEASMLNLLEPTLLVAATDRITQQIELLDTLKEKGYTYELPDGIYFDSSKFKSYSDFAKLDVSGLESGKRVADSGKKNLTDFAVWKFTPEGTTRDMQWEYPLGSGRMGFPGWHLECSAIAMTELGEQIDIHTGGIDHIPVHHSNEIAQSESATGKRFSDFWIHNNHMKINGAKLAKSKGNGITLSDLTDEGYKIESFKLFVLSSHYRTEGDLSWKVLNVMQEKLHNWKESIARRYDIDAPDVTDSKKFDTLLIEANNALTDDLNTPGCIEIIDKYINTMNDHQNKGESTVQQSEKVLDFIRNYLGIGMQWGTSTDLKQEITLESATITAEKLLSLRATARKEKNWDESDRLRLVARKSGLAIDDTAHGRLYYNHHSPNSPWL